VPSRGAQCGKLLCERYDGGVVRRSRPRISPASSPPARLIRLGSVSVRGSPLPPQSSEAAYTVVGTTIARRKAKSGRSACSSASEWRAVPPVAAASTALPVRASLSMTSKNDLKSPLYEAEKTGVTAIRPSAEVTVSMASSRLVEGKPVTRLFAMSAARSRSSTTWTSTSRPASASCSRTAWVRRSASSRVDDGTLRPADTTARCSG
jgi:hypothetical protein